MDLQIRESRLEQPVRTLTESLFRQKGSFVSLFFLVLIAVVSVTFTTKRQYPSRMKLLIENNRSNVVITPDRGQSSAANGITDEQFNSEIEILGSDDVLSEVADPQWVHLTSAEKTPAAIKQHEEAINRFRGHLSVQPAKKSNVIDVTFTADTPAEATRKLELFSSAYMALRKSLTRPSGAAAFFAFEARRYEDAWHQANENLVNFQKAQNLVSEQDAQLALAKQIDEYEDRLHQNEANLTEIQERLATARQVGDSVPRRHETQIHTTQASTESLRALLLQLQNRRTELLTRYVANDPLVTEINHQIEQTNSALEEAKNRKGTDETTDINPIWQQLATTVVQGGVEYKALLGRQQSLRESVATLRKRLGELQAVDVKFNSLQEQSDEARSNYKLFTEKRDQAQIEDAMDERQLTNVALIQKPTSAYLPTSPQIKLNLALGSVTALFLAFGAVYLLESTRSTVATARELERSSPYPVLATCGYSLRPVTPLDLEATPASASSGRRPSFTGAPFSDFATGSAINRDSAPS